MAKRSRHEPKSEPAILFAPSQVAKSESKPPGTDRLRVTHPDLLKVTHLVSEDGRFGQERQFYFYCDFLPFFCFIDSRKR
jgi:hypothetical protein